MTDFRPRPFAYIPPVVKNLIIVNVLVLLAQTMLQGKFDIDNLFALHDVRSVYFRPHQLITYMFMHGGFYHLFGNMLAVYFFGSELENLWGSKRFLTFYVLCGLGATILHLSILYVELTPVVEEVRRLPYDLQQQFLYSDRNPMNGITVGASGAVFGVLAAFGYLFPNSLLYIYFLFPVKAKWVVIAYIGIELFMGIQNSAGDNVAHWAHLGGAAVGLLLVWFWNKNNRRTFY